MRILLIDDKKKVADIIDRGLQAGRYAVDVCHDGQSGREATEAFNYTIQLRVENESAGPGLSIVKSICDAHGARVEARSTAGRGSCFRVTLAAAKN